MFVFVVVLVVVVLAAGVVAGLAGPHGFGNGSVFSVVPVELNLTNYFFDKAKGCLENVKKMNSEYFWCYDSKRF